MLYTNISRIMEQRTKYSAIVTREIPLRVQNIVDNSIILYLITDVS